MSILKLLVRIVVALLAVVWRACIIVTPLLGVWLSSSLIAFFGGPREAALVGGVMLFPIVPLLWEARGQRRFAKKIADARARGADASHRVLKTFDRVVLRTLFINGAFLGALLAFFPKPAFTALATRGDWFLDGHHSATSENVRTGLFAAAEGLGWLHELANPNPNKKKGDDTPVPDNVKPVVAKKDDAKPAGTWSVGDASWPQEGKLHPVVTSMPASAETSIAAVATYIAQHEPDPFLRTKALHDWTVSRLHYDHDSVTGVRKPQDAQSVFNNRMGVCEGYARLLVDLGKYAGVPIVYVVGEVREDDGEAAPVGHAWNAVQVKERWYFLDATWDDPVMEGGAGGDNYQTDYLFTPPAVAIFDHLPDDARWQLLDKPLTRGDFLRQPMARPGFAKLGLTLKQPDRPVVDAQTSVEVVIENPRGLHMMVQLVPHDQAGQGTECPVDGTTLLRARCALPGPGRYDVRLFANAEKFGRYGWVANLGVNSR